ncbi:glycosyltransferase family 2 protein [Candidatus Magnetaquicoccus inordinatus]|uniref:glycosyltransferase family 2 protein n=1 Tax=Candidatus Magnetaquicoccus inordinatus TaxID=2496818 RepID=UPI00102C01C0|nr:glycosyltransferase [Candidatus Magnetaquicoccus inordinatus]
MKKHKAQNSTPLVTVVVLSYHRAPYTDRTLQALTSIDAGVDFELIVVDNGSDADSVAALQAWEQSGLIDQLILLPNNLGTSAGFNTGFQAAHPHTQFLTKLDNDILVISPQWLRQIVDTLNNEENVGIASTDMINHTSVQKLPVLTLPSGRQVRDWHGWRAGGGGMTFRKELYQQIGGFRTDFPDELKLMPDDLAFYSSVTKMGLCSYYVCAAQSSLQLELDNSFTDYRSWKIRQYQLLSSRFFNIAKGASHFAPFISAIHLATSSWQAGQRLIVEITLTSSLEQLCWIGMSLINGQQSHSDPYSDIVVRSKAGQTTVLRWLQLPMNAQPGQYDLVIRLSALLINENRLQVGTTLDLLRQGGAVTIVNNLA